MYKQLIIARKDLNMSTGKLAAQVSHASMAFLTNIIKENLSFVRVDSEKNPHCYLEIEVDSGIYDEWLNGSFTKIVCQAKNKNQIMKAVTIAQELGLVEGKDYFLIRDNCLTELEPEDEDGRTLTCIGFVPMDSSIVEQISKKFQLYT